MIEGGEAMSDGDVQRLAMLHQQTMPHSVLGRLGGPTLRRYYQWVANSRVEHVFIAREDGEVTGVAVLSEQPSTVIRRFVLAHPLRFMRDALATFLHVAEFRREALSFLRERSNDADTTPEVLQIFVAHERQARHTGTRLLERVEQWLRRRRRTRYYARTLATGNDATLAFYGRRGFREVGRRTFCGTRVLVLEKTVE
jgi:GNAT superfamily N-acetyltransferase